jgi:hypothetical protein
LIEKKQLNETDLIVGDHWPEYDEDAYSREADKLHDTAYRAGEAASSAGNAEAYTADEFHGLSGSAMQELMNRRRSELSTSQDRHTSVGKLMERAAGNIIATKTEINDAQVTYHEKFDEAMKLAADEGWPQHHLNEVKSELVREGQSRVQSARSVFDQEHQSIVDGISGSVTT